MKLLDLKSVNKTLAKQLLIDGWTVEKLATTTAPILAKVRGISLKGAGQIITEAQKLVNQSGLKESQMYGSNTSMAEIGLKSVKVSSRVRRAKMSKVKS